MPNFGNTVAPTTSARAVSSKEQIATQAILSEPGIALSISWYLSQTLSSAQLATMALWADASGVPGPLVAEGAPTSVPGGLGAGWLNFPLTTNPLLEPGLYWIGAYCDVVSAQILYKLDVGGATELAFNATAITTGPTDPFGPVTYLTDVMGIYVNYAIPQPGILVPQSVSSQLRS